MRIIIIGLANELPLNAPEALDIADRIVRRAAAIKTGLLCCCLWSCYLVFAD